MVNIVYGVAGEGSGHSSRASEIIAYLMQQGHTVKIFSYDRGYQNLKQNFDVTEIAGLNIVSANNVVSPIKTVIKNITAIPYGQESLKIVKEVIRNFKPECVITDLEPMTAHLANHFDLPLISIDNQHWMRYMEYECPKRYIKDALIAESIIRAIVPKPSVSLITTFCYGNVKNKTSFLVPPILRQSVLNTRASPGSHILVYVTAGFRTLVKTLMDYKREKFVVYGYNREGVEGPLNFKPYSNEGFVSDLASCKAVIASAGFSLITEALFFGKPYFAIPMKGQFEQILNSIILKNLGYGSGAMSVTAEHLSAFLYSIPDFAEQLLEYRRETNAVLFAKLDYFLSNGAQALYDIHRSKSS